MNTQKFTLDDINDSITYDEAVSELAEIFPEKKNRMFARSLQNKFAEQFIPILKKCDNHTLSLIELYNVRPLLLDVRYVNNDIPNTRDDDINRIASLLAMILADIANDIFFKHYERIVLQRFKDDRGILRLPLLWLAKRNDGD